jgi:hypothetical protein
MGLITASLAKIPIQEVYVNEEELKAKEWRQKSITGKCPVLETE